MTARVIFNFKRYSLSLLVSLVFLSSTSVGAQKLLDYRLPSIEPDTLVSNHMDNLRRFKALNIDAESFLVQMYGQSIVAGLESEAMQGFFNDLIPGKKVEVINNGIGGYRAPTLIKTAYSDLYPNYPDLLFFHVYGGIKDGVLNTYFKEIRQRLGSDVLIFDHHYSFVNDEGGQRRLNEGEWTKSRTIKSLAIKNGFGFIEVRKYWKEFLDMNPELVITDLLKDRVHPNHLGEELLHYILQQSIMVNLSVEPDAVNPKVTIVDEDELIYYNDNQVQIEFTGNRLDAIVPDSGDNSKYQIFIDGKRALKSNLFYATRLGHFPGQWYPVINQISLDTSIPNQQEEWEFNFYNIDYTDNTYRFDLKGSITGLDGGTISGNDFKSNSGRISFKSEDVTFLPPSKRMIEEKVEQQKIKFQTLPLFKDPLIVKKPGQFTLIKGISNDRHTVTIVASQPTDFKDWKFKVYRPLKKSSD